MGKTAKLLMVGVAYLAYIGTSNAQAPPGPMQPAPGSTPVANAPAPPVAKKPQAKPRNNILGDWKLNHDESDDPHEKLQQARENSGNNGGNRGGGGYGQPRIGFPGGGMGGPGMGGGGNRGQNQGADIDSMQEKINPALQMNFAQKTSRDPEVDLTDEQNHTQKFFTDGRKLQKPTDSTSEEVAAKWDGPRLVTEEKGAHGGKLSRTYELSPDGLQLWESIKINTGRGNYPVTIRYVYDAVDDVPGKPANQAATSH